MSDILWEPDPRQAEQTLLHRFLQAAPVEDKTYQALWEWSTDDLPGFWQQVWDECGVVASEPPQRVMGEPRMPGTEWFAGARLNFAENLLRRRDDHVAVIGAGEGRDDEHVTFAELAARVARAQQGLRGLGVSQDDRVAGFLPNAVETVVLMLASASLGALWSTCSPDFGPTGVVDRFGQIEPKVLCVANGYRFGGKVYPLGDKVSAVLEGVKGVEHVVTVDFVSPDEADLGDLPLPTTSYEALLDNDATEPDFVQLPFDHPLYILYSSGTTGAPKSIVHGAGNTLIQHLKEHQLHCDIRRDDVVLWFTTTGWMMWNWLVSVLACEATIVLYDGSPAEPDLGALWRLAERTRLSHFGISAGFLAANQKNGVVPPDEADLSSVRTVMSTGSPLNPEQFDWFYDHVENIQLASVSGGTDLVGCFVGGAPILPVHRGELQCRHLGMAVEAWDDEGNAVIGEKGELVCVKPFPTMPLYFWNDPDGERYREAYFELHPGVWTHGDFIEIREDGGAVIHGRSDTTLNPGGVRIGTAEIYRAVEGLPELADSIVFGRSANGDMEIVLCVKLAEGAELDDELLEKIRSTIRSEASPRHVPKHVFSVDDVPYTVNGKKVEKAARKMVNGEEVTNRDALANPDALDQYAKLPFS